MPQPAFQFYPGDWRKSTKLRRCSEAARGAWMDVMCIMHGSEEYGVLRWPLREIAHAAGVPLRLLKELAEKGVLKGADKGAADYVWAPTHAGQKGEPVTLVEAGAGPCWYCSRFVRDAEIRRRRGQGSRFGVELGEGKETPKDHPKPPPNPPFGEGIGGESGDGPSSSSSSSKLGNTSTSVEDEERANARARAVTQACIQLRKMGMQVQPQMPQLHDLVARGATLEQMAMTAAELALRKAGMFGDSDLHPELLELFASGATQQQMLLTTDQYTALRNAAPNLGYLAQTLIGRAQDAARGEGHGTTGNGRSHAGRNGGHGSAAGRAEAARRAGDARDAASADDTGF